MESDEERAKNEEQEGRRLQAEQAATLAQQVDQVDDLMAQVADAEASAEIDAGRAAAGKKRKSSAAERSDADLLRDMDVDLDGLGDNMALELDLDIAALTGAEPAGAAAGRQPKSARVLVERIEQDMSAVSEAAKLQLLLTSSPELLSLLDDFKENMEQLRGLLPLWEDMKDQQDEKALAWVSGLLHACNSSSATAIGEHAHAHASSSRLALLTCGACATALVCRCTVLFCVAEGAHADAALLPRVVLPVAERRG